MNILKKDVGSWGYAVLNQVFLWTLPVTFLVVGYQIEMINVSLEAIDTNQIQKIQMIKKAEAEVKTVAEMTTEDYICYRFGPDCKMALAVSQAENGTRQCDRFGVNTNKTIDVGVFQLNSVHLKKGYTLADFMDCKKNTDIAFEIFQAQGWNPWVAWQNKNYLRFLK